MAFMLFELGLYLLAITGVILILGIIEKIVMWVINWLDRPVQPTKIDRFFDPDWEQEY